MNRIRLVVFLAHQSILSSTHIHNPVKIRFILPWQLSIQQSDVILKSIEIDCKRGSFQVTIFDFSKRRVDSFFLHFSGPPGEVCTKAIPNRNQSVCFLISCPNNTQNLSCENITNFDDMLAEPSVNTTGNTSPWFACIFLCLCFQ